MASSLRLAGGDRPEVFVRIRGLAFRPSSVAGGWKPGRRFARLRALPLREAPRVADRSVVDVERNAEGSLPEAGGQMNVQLRDELAAVR